VSKDSKFITITAASNYLNHFLRFNSTMVVTITPFCIHVYHHLICSSLASQLNAAKSSLRS